MTAPLPENAEPDRRAAETRWQERASEIQALLAAIVESSDDAIVSKTLEGVVTSWNSGAERLFGYTAAEAIGRSITLVIPPERLDEEEFILGRIRQGQHVKHFETVRVTKDGRRVHVSVTVSPVHDAGGRIIGASSVKRDVTARVQADSALRASQARFLALAENAPAAIYVKDKSGRYTIANSMACEALGRPEGAVGFTDHELLPADVADALRQMDEQVMTTGQPLEREEIVRRKDFERTYLSVKFPVLDAVGYGDGVCGVSIDITERKQAEQALRLADQRKDEFLAMLAHELRNPLAPITNSVHILRLADDVDPTLEKVREILERQTNHLARLVDDLLDVTRIAQGKIELRPERVELAAVVRNAVEASRPLIDAGRHQLAISLPTEPIMLEADPTRLAQVVSNLLNNAARYTPAGGQIWLSAGIDLEQAVLVVRDNGQGIPRDELSRIFDKFAQVASAAGTLQGGLGIGLTLARTLVELHGGRIEAHSDGMGQGSQFTVRLPLAAAKPPLGPPCIAGAQEAAAEPSLKILIVDDARDSAFVLGKLLQTLGQQVLTSDSAIAALEIVRRERPQVVISDIGMADMDGYEFARRLRQDPATSDILLVALTGYGHQRDRMRALEAGFDHHVIKPVSFATLKSLFASLPRRGGSKVR
jgi:PAS domain S-box-containing protein